MKKRLLKIGILLIISSFLLVHSGILNRVSSTARAVGDLSVDWGVPEGDPIFVVNNFVKRGG